MNELENIKLTFQTLQLSVLKQINLFAVSESLLSNWVVLMEVTAF